MNLQIKFKIQAHPKKSANCKAKSSQNGWSSIGAGLGAAMMAPVLLPTAEFGMMVAGVSSLFFGTAFASSGAKGKDKDCPQNGFFANIGNAIASIF